MIQRLVLAAFAACLMLSPGAAGAAVEPTGRIEISQMMGRWYEVARVPNALQNGCLAGASDWTPQAAGFAVVQSCRKAGPSGPLKTWKARATVSDARTNAKLKMTFFGGVVSQDYVVMEHRPAEGWLVLATANGKYLWLMSQKPVLPAAIKSQALARIRQLGFDIGRLEFPLPARS
ncbi:MAG: lipocalin family protein [Alphaproteobacteria bacterium]|nr:lipocalin family protein [Alphaproteobacteria bacterium]MBU1514677.1 lipocalin family protein [Alphaproteobacteria bacterium]MBU2093536.1 lipocalin family protein [Alphaproteobacteria bacterium]MBU2149450.1 lipocalin family protein [Alphaproteobacteria bacterium]MBU2305507.1 lipocalin family protein [Alphaproteobacteria bacterium]